MGDRGRRWWPILLLALLPLAEGAAGRLGTWALPLVAGGIIATAAFLFWAVAVDQPLRLAVATPGMIAGLGLVGLGFYRAVPQPAVKEMTAAIAAPIGAIIAWGGEADPPSGWLPCDGRELTRDAYPELYHAIGTAHGAGDGRTTFLLPDFRGRFLRGVDAGTARDPDAADRSAPAPGGRAGDRVGSIQEDQLGAHRHRYVAFVLKDIDWQRGLRHPANGTGDAGERRDTDRIGGGETRPKNAYVAWVIRAQ